MKYTDWNDLLYHYYFDDVNDSVFLFVDKDSLMQYALESKKFDGVFLALEKGGKTNYTNSDEAKLEYIWQDFCRIFKEKDKSFAPSLDYFKQLFEKKIAESTDREPQFFPLIALCLMPFEESQGLNANNFYDRVNGFLSENNIIPKDITKNKFSSIFTSIKGIIKIWEILNNWSRKNSLPYTSKFVQLVDRNDYVKPFLSECLITPTKRQLFSVLFRNLGLAPNIEYKFTDDQILHFLSNRYTDLGFSNDQWKNYKKNYSSVIIDEFKRAYAKWNGDTWVIRRLGLRKERIESGSVYNMFLTMQNSLGNYSFYLRLYAPQIERGEHLLLNYEKECFDTRIGIDGYGQNPILKNCPFLFDALRNKERIELLVNSNDKAVFVPTDFFLLQQKGMEFSTACSLVKGARFYFLKKDNNNSYDSWLQENQSSLLKENINNTGYSLYLIPKVLTSFSSDIKLTIDDKKSASLIDTLKLSFDRPHNTYNIYNGFPAYFSIKGVDVNSKVTATTYDENDLAKHVYPLEYCPEDNLWKMPIITYHFDKERAFRLFNDGQSLSNFKFAFKGLIDITNEAFAELRFNKWGQYDSEGDFQGLTLPNLRANGIPRDMKSNMESRGEEPNKGLDKYEETDFILYFLSSHPSRLITKEEIKDIFCVLNRNKIISDDNAGNDYKIKRLLNNYCRLGYINYFYDKNDIASNEPYKIAVNRPTLIMLPPRYEAHFTQGLNGKEQKSFICAESWYKFMLTGARTPQFVNKVIQLARNHNDIRVHVNKSLTPLYPHEIIIWANTEEAITTFANTLKIGLQFCVYSKTLFDKLGNLEDYIESVKQKESQFLYDNVSSYQVVDYANLDSIDICKEYMIPMKPTINKDSEMVCYWPGTGHTEEQILWYKNRVFPLEKFWANYVGAFINHKQIIKVEDYHIITPYKFRLPVIFDRALTLISGKLPDVVFVNGKRQYLDYSLYDSPFIHINSSLIARKLNQHNNL